VPTGVGAGGRSRGKALATLDPYGERELARDRTVAGVRYCHCGAISIAKGGPNHLASGRSDGATLWSTANGCIRSSALAVRPCPRLTKADFQACDCERPLRAPCRTSSGVRSFAKSRHFRPTASSVAKLECAPHTRTIWERTPRRLPDSQPNALRPCNCYRPRISGPPPAVTSCGCRFTRRARLIEASVSSPSASAAHRPAP
jgi:hypothetical protein